MERSRLAWAAKEARCLGSQLSSFLGTTRPPVPFSRKGSPSVRGLEGR